MAFMKKMEKRNKMSLGMDFAAIVEGKKELKRLRSEMRELNKKKYRDQANEHELRKLEMISVEMECLEKTMIHAEW